LKTPKHSKSKGLSSLIKGLLKKLITWIGMNFVTL